MHTPTLKKNNKNKTQIRDLILHAYFSMACHKNFFIHDIKTFQTVVQ